MSLTYFHAPIEKSEKLDDGTLLVYGKMTGPDLDLDGQVCDPAWLKTAVPEWFKVGNVREMHQAWAVGKGVQLEEDGDDYWLTAKIVDGEAIKKVEEGVYTGYSIGIKSPKIVKDAAAPNGRINGGLIVENSLVDRPCNETAKLVLAKMVKGAWSATDVIVKDANAIDPEPDPGEEAAEVDLIATARDALTQWLAEEAAEVAEGTGGRMVVRLICDVLSDLDWAAEADAYDDVNAALAAVKSVLTTPKEDPEVLNLSTVADLVKAATADDAPEPAKTELAELVKALGIDDITTKIATAVTEATTPLEETIKGLSAELAKVNETVVSNGPVRVRTQADAAKAAATDELLQKAAHFEQLASTVTDPTLALGYRELAEQERAKIPTKDV